MAGRPLTNRDEESQPLDCSMPLCAAGHTVERGHCLFPGPSSLSVARKHRGSHTVSEEAVGLGQLPGLSLEDPCPGSMGSWVTALISVSVGWLALLPLGGGEDVGFCTVAVLRGGHNVPVSVPLSPQSWE